MTLSSWSAIDSPIVMPPRNCERAVFAFMMLPAAKTPSRRGTRTPPLSRLTRTKLAGGIDDGGSPRGGSHRATGELCGRQQRIANFEMHALQWNLECICSDLCKDCPR